MIKATTMDAVQPTNLRILEAVQAGDEALLILLLQRRAQEHGVPVATIALMVRDSDGRGITRYCVQGSSIMAECKYLSISLTFTTQSPILLKVSSPSKIFYVRVFA